MNNPTIGIIGTGAVGGYFGAKLVDAGFDVTFIATENSAKIIEKEGFYISSPEGDIEIKKPVVHSDLNKLKDVDVILLCTKSYDTEKIATELKDIITDSTIVISMQNGIENEEILASILGSKNIIAASIYLSAASLRAGEITHAGSGKIILGELNKEITPRLKNLEKMFRSASIPTKTSEYLIKDMWVKLIVNSAYNGITALIGKSLKDINKVPEAKSAYYNILKEGQTIANTEGIEISEEEINKIYSMLDQEVFINFKSSTLQDLEKHKPLEIDAIQGTLIKIAKKHNINAPLNNFIYGLLKLKEIERN